MDLLNYQWELDGVVFGMDCPVDHEADSEPSSYSWRSQDQSVPSRDGMIPGRDLIDPGTWNFKLFTNADDEDGALTALEEIATVWRGDSVRDTPGAVLPLRYRLNNRTRRVYGRPRRFSAPLGTEFHGGRIMVTADFQTVSELFFDDLEQSVTVSAVAPVTGGMESPLVSPLSTTVQAASRPNTAQVDTLLPTPMVVTFHGPSSDAYLDIDGVRVIELDGEVAADQPIIVDARPWVMAAYRQDGAGVAGILSRRTRLPQLLLTKGTHVLSYGSSDTLGTSYATVSWRRANPTV